MLGLLLPHLAGTAVDGAGIERGPGEDLGACGGGRGGVPGVRDVVHGVRGRYARRLHDVAAGGRRVVIRLGVRLLACGGAGCPRATFAEQPAGLAVPYARKTPLLAGQLRAVAAALAGRAGSRLARPCWRWRSAWTRWCGC